MTISEKAPVWTGANTPTGTAEQHNESALNAASVLSAGEPEHRNVLFSALVPKLIEHLNVPKNVPVQSEFYDKRNQEIQRTTYVSEDIVLKSSKTININDWREKLHIFSLEIKWIAFTAYKVPASMKDQFGEWKVLETSLARIADSSGNSKIATGLRPAYSEDKSQNETHWVFEEAVSLGMNIFSLNDLEFLRSLVRALWLDTYDSERFMLRAPNFKAAEWETFSREKETAFQVEQMHFSIQSLREKIDSIESKLDLVLGEFVLYARSYRLVRSLVVDSTQSIPTLYQSSFLKPERLVKLDKRLDGADVIASTWDEEWMENATVATPESVFSFAISVVSSTLGFRRSIAL